jgi:hypothetical protein
MIDALPMPTPKDFREMAERQITWPELCAARVGECPESTAAEKRRSSAFWTEEQHEVYKVLSA